MLEVQGDIWEAHALGHWIVITTNGIVRRDGACVMGRGVARDAALRFPDLPYRLGKLLTEHGNHVFSFEYPYRMFTFPVKHHWREPADPALIEQSAREIASQGITDRLYMVRPGCGNGQLDWETVRLLIAPILDDSFIVVHP